MKILFLVLWVIALVCFGYVSVVGMACVVRRQTKNWPRMDWVLWGFSILMAVVSAKELYSVVEWFSV